MYINKADRSLSEKIKERKSQAFILPPSPVGKKKVVTKWKGKLWRETTPIPIERHWRCWEGQYKVKGKAIERDNSMQPQLRDIEDVVRAQYKSWSERIQTRWIQLQKWNI